MLRKFSLVLVDSEGYVTPHGAQLPINVSSWTSANCGWQSSCLWDFVLTTRSKQASRSTLRSTGLDLKPIPRPTATLGSVVRGQSLANPWE